VVAARDLQIGTLIGPEDVRMGSWMGALPKGALAKLDLALNRGAIANMYQGEPIIADRLAATGSGGGLAAIISPGLRASAVRVDEVVGLAGFVTPGMRVDVLMSGIPPGGNPSEGSRVNTLLQNIQVLSAGENLQKNSEGKPEKVQVVNLLVTPEQAEKLTLASSQTRIQLVLRNPLDTATASPPGAAMSELFGPPAGRPARAPESTLGGRLRTDRTALAERSGTPRPAGPTPPRATEMAPKIRVVEVFNGTARTEVKFTIGDVQGKGEDSK
jgi:pilus assembly protein CpaB